MRFFLFFLCLASTLQAAFPDPVLFLTWKKDPAKTMTAVWLTEDPAHLGLIQWKLEGEENYRQKAAVKTLATFCKRKFYIMQAEITFLKPDTVYQFKIEGQNQLHKFKTAPKELNHPVRFIVGGDVYHDEISNVEKMMHGASCFDPLFCVLGGDLAYAFTSKNSEDENIDRWFTFLSTYEKHMVTPDGLMIPMLPILGNHDIKGGYLAGVRNAKFFFSVFPTPGNLGYSAFDFGNWMSLLLLDSGHANPVGGAQTFWLQKSLEKKKDFDYLFAIYHVTAYPSYRAFGGKRPQEIRKHWIPLFDTAHLTAAFEHHDHTLKRTVPLKGDCFHKEGVIYLGDGSFGIGDPRVPHDQLWYLAFAKSAQAVWGVTVDKAEATFKAISPEGKVLDQTNKKSRKKALVDPPRK